MPWSSLPLASLQFIGLLWIFVVVVVGSSLLYWLGDRDARRDFAQRAMSWTPVVAWLCGAILLGPLAFVLMMGLASSQALTECLRSMGWAHAGRTRIIATLITIGAVVGSLFCPPWMCAAAAAACLAAAGLLMVKGAPITGAAGVLIAMVLSFLPTLCLVPVALTIDSEHPGASTGIVLFILAITQFNDFFQYFAGKLFGRHKLAPVVSPKKTWEGAVGGAVFPLVMACFYAGWLVALPTGLSLLAAAAMCIGGVAGDLVVSLFKRALGVKDLGDLLPGFGGILDRVDSLVLNASGAMAIVLTVQARWAVAPIDALAHNLWSWS